MVKRALLVGSLLLTTSCYKDKGSSTTAPPPPSNTVAQPRVTVDYSRTIADPLGFLPIDSEIVLGLDVEQLRKSPFWVPAAAKLSTAGGNDLAAFKMACGTDPMATVRSITMGIKNLSATPDGVMVVSGLDRAALMACMEKAPKTTTTIQNGIVVITSTSAPGAGGLGAPAGGAQSTVAFAFVDASTVVGVMGPSASREHLRAVLAAGAPLRSSPAFTEIVKHTDLAASGWMMLNGSSKVFDQAAGALGTRPKAAFGSINVTNGVSMDMRLRLEDAAHATQLAPMIGGQVGMARAMFTKLDITTDDVDLVMSLAMTDAQLTQLLQLAGVTLNGP
jgi:hypothetical protein